MKRAAAKVSMCKRAYIETATSKRHETYMSGYITSGIVICRLKTNLIQGENITKMSQPFWKAFSQRIVNL